MEIQVTVFTPTYNRGYIIEKLYNSLKNQQCKSFEWVVVDDGSTDDTMALFKEWEKKDHGFPIRYYYKNNGGKHRAINDGVKHANGRLFIIVDSDDYLTEDAIKMILEREVEIRAQGSFAGLGFNKGKDRKNIVGSTFRGKSIDATSIQRINHNITGDKAEVFYTNILRHYQFPEFPNEKFITENVVWYKIANDGYKIRWFNEIIYICEYLDDGLTSNANSLALNNFNGYTYTIKELLKYNLHPKEKAVLIGVYTRTAKIKGLSFKEISKNIGIGIYVCYFLEKLSKISRFIKSFKKSK
ncbi:glycosyltransferase family A protein [Ureibacillus composti]|nr:glycosyltransferase family A protein [Ureibacillus composti]